MAVTIETEAGAIVVGGCGDLAERWGVTTQRVRQLAQLDGFPPSLGTVNGQVAYDVDEADGWREITKRRRGRPVRAEVSA